MMPSISLNFTRKSIIKFFVFPVSGAILLALLSILAKIQIGADPWKLSGYIFPSTYGAIGGAIFGVWAVRLQLSLLEQSSLRAHYHDLFENASDLIQSIDLDGSLQYVNKAWKETLGYSDDEVRQLNFFDLILPEEVSHCRERFAGLIAGEAVPVMEVTFVDKKGHHVQLEGDIRLRLSNDRPHSVQAIYRNISHRKVIEEKIHQLAYYDHLTGLPNRALLQDRLTHAIADAKRLQHGLGVAFLDLDQFKKINDTCGHAVGDLLLIEVAKRLRDTLRENDTAARLAGDEFVIILSGFHHPSNLPHIAQKILANLSQPYHCSGYDFNVSASLGLAVYPHDGKTADELMTNADMAMYAAKENGKNCFEFFSQTMNETAARQLHLENDLRQALSLDQFVIHYQPLVDLNKRQVCAVEALLRWQHPVNGLLLPATFIAVAEELRLINSIGAWVLHQACADVKEMQRELGMPIGLSVNMCGCQFDDPQLPELVLRILKQCDLNPEQLEMEMTEAVLICLSEEGKGVVKQLSDAGVRIAVDNFGSGFSSLSSLRNIPVNRLKVDKAFLAENLHDATEATIMESVIVLARTMGMDVVAEGVERAEQVDYLIQHDCRHMQGFHFAAPMTAPAMCSYLLQQQQGALMC